MKKPIVIYRHQLFKPSETFVAGPAEILVRHLPVYVGNRLHGEPPPSANVFMIQENGFYGRLLHQFSRQPDTRVVSELRRLGVGLVHAHFGVDGVYAVELARILDVPLATTFHGFDAATPVYKFFFSGRPALMTYGLLRRRLVNFGSIFLCASDYIRRKAIDFGCDENRTITHYTGIDTNIIRPRELWNDAKIILHVARLVEIKGTRYLIDAFSDVLAKLPDARLVIIGDGPLREQLQRVAAEKNLSRSVEFLGYLPYSVVAEWLARSSVLCLPSITMRSGAQEGLGTVLLEAAAAGVPSVGTRTGGIPESIADGITGYLVPERDPQSLADRLVALLSQDDVRRTMGEAARRRVEQHFDLTRQTATLEDLYEKISR